jgi:large subunit ribosomal protein L10
VDKQGKIELIDQFRGKFSAAKVAVVTEYRGLSVEQMTELRRDIRGVAGEFRVVKNKLVRLAIRDTAYEELDRLLQGPNGWAFGYEDPVDLSKALVKFAERNEALKIKGAVVEGDWVEPGMVKELANMPSRPELQAQVLSLMQAPAIKLLQTIQEPGARMVRLVEKIRQGKESA